jgi:dTDP-4-dehydrorhamnose 3,5-epimerase
MAFKKFDTDIEGLVILEPDVFGDARGYFKETYNQEHFAGLGLDLNFVQDNVSYSAKGILRGLHFQAPPYAQGKLVTVLQGEVVDVAVDIRRSSPTYGKHLAVRLSAENHRMLYVPPGFAHGFQVVSETCLFCYKCTGFYRRAAEGGLRWNDPGLGIEWPITTPLISDKDKEYGPFSSFESPFE